MSLSFASLRLSVVLILGGGLFLIFSATKLCQMCILAFGSDDVPGLWLGALPIFICLAVLIFGFVRNDINIIVANICAAILGIIPPFLIGLIGMLAIIYNVEINSVSRYDSQCFPIAGESIDGNILRVCERRDWAHLDLISFVIKLDGDPTKLINHAYSKPPKHINPLDRLVPFGIVKYQYRHISGPYYVLIFGDQPVFMNDS